MALRYPLVLNGTTIEELQSADSLDVTSASISGDLTFTGTGARVKANFSDATIANRLLFQTSTANSVTLFGLIPSGTGVSSAIYGSTNSDPTADASYFDLRVSGATGLVRLTADRDGAAPYYPIAFFTGGSERVRIDTSGNFNIAGLTASRALATDASKNLVSSTATSTELGYLSGVTSAIQTQLNSKAGTATANTFTNNQIISVNSSSDALRITQTGAGNALVVEDEANPDATPFIIDSVGNIGQGLTSITTTGFTGGYIAKSSTAFGPQLVYENATNDVNGPYYILQKGRAGAVVQSGDTLGNFQFRGFDGTNFVRGASIEVAVDGTPGTNDMPGRLLFSTTADGASSPTERMRIDNQGRVGIGGTAGADTQLQLLGTYATSGAVTRVVRANGTIPSSTTGTARIYGTEITTQAASFTVSSLQHFYAAQAALGLGSAVTNQYGFLAEASLTGATNNYGFYSNIASGTGRYNFYAAGTAANYFAGNVGIGGDASVSFETFASATNWIRNNSAAGIPIFAAYKSNGTISSKTIVASGDEVGRFDIRGYDGANFVQLAQIGGFVDGTPGTNDMPGRLVFSTTADGASSPTEAFRINSLQNVLFGRPYGGNDRIGIGGATSSISTTTSANGITNDTIVSSAQTGAYTANSTYISTQAASFVLSNMTHYKASQFTIGAGSSVTAQYGFVADSTLTGATNNFGFYSIVPSGSGRYNFYAAGTADNYFAGKIGIGGVPTTFVSADIQGTYPAGSFTRGFRAAATIPSSVIGNARLFSTEAYTQAASFTLGSLTHYLALQQTIGAGSTVTNQYGFSAETTLTGAANNYGFYGNIASGSGRYNFYAAGTADNYFAGDVTVASTNDPAFSVTGGVRIGSSTATGSTRITSGLNWNFSPLSIIRATSNSATVRTLGFMLDGDSLSSTGIGDYNAIWGAYDSAPTTGSTSSALNGAMVYGAYAGHRWYVNGSERMRIDNAGRVGIGTTPTAGVSLQLGKTITGAANAYQIFGGGVIQSDVTGVSGLYVTVSATAAASFTLGSLNHFWATQGAIGAGSTVTNQYGFHANSNLTGATNNYGFYSNIASGTGRYNFYAAGTADNYFAGAIKGNTTIAGGYTAHTAGTTAMALGSNNVVKVTPNATATFTTTVAPAGATASIIIVTSGTTSYTITFGTGFLTTGTLATGTVTAKTFVVNFVSDGTTMIETSRTVAM